MDAATALSLRAIELAALSETELPGLLAFLEEDPALPCDYVSVHAPSKGREMPEEQLIALLADLPAWVDTIVAHPTTSTTCPSRSSTNASSPRSWIAAETCRGSSKHRHAAVEQPHDALPRLAAQTDTEVPTLIRARERTRDELRRVRQALFQCQHRRP